jgi:hypothetical protein
LVGLYAVSLLTSLLFSIITDATGIGIPAFGRAYSFLSPSVALTGVRRFPDVLLLLLSLCCSATCTVFAADGPQMLLQAFFLWQWKVPLMLLLSQLLSTSMQLLLFCCRDLCLLHVGIHACCCCLRYSSCLLPYLNLNTPAE